MAALDEAIAQAVRGLGQVALALLIVTGEWLAHTSGHPGLVSIPALRGLHTLAGFALTIALLYRLGQAGGRLGRLFVRHQGLYMEDLAWAAARLFTGRGLLAAAYGVALCLMILSGLERYAQLRYAVAVLPLFPPLVWESLHAITAPYLYAIVLLMAFNWSKVALRRALDYLYTP